MPNPSPSSETLDVSSYARKSRLIFVCPRFTKVTKIAAQQHIGPRVIRMLSEIMTYRLRSVIRGVLFPDVARSRQSINAITPSDVSAVPVVVPVTQLFSNMRHIEQSIVPMQRVGGKSENKVTLLRCLTNHRLADG